MMQHSSEFTNLNLEVMFTAKQIQERIKEMGAEIARDYADKNPLLVGVLKGACVFMSDLIRTSDMQLEIDFMIISSYGERDHSSGAVEIKKDLTKPIEDRDILVIEDIVDTGLTLNYLLDHLKRKGAASVKLAALLSKPERRLKEVEIDYLGFTIPDKFVVGYGLDFAERYRNLPFIGVVKDLSSEG
jgi:hypoxanthine phosphoribosyltransferase